MTVDHILHCWEMKENGILMTVHTNNNIAPEDLVELVSCNCNNDCVDGCCTCKTNNVLCRSYGCGDECQNTDASPPPSACNDKDDDDEQL